MTAVEPGGRTIVLARGQHVTTAHGRVRGYAVRIQLGQIADVNLDIATAIELYDALRAHLAEVLPGGRWPVVTAVPGPFAADLPAAFAPTQAHPDAPAVPPGSPVHDGWPYT